MWKVSLNQNARLECSWKCFNPFVLGDRDSWLNAEAIHVLFSAVDFGCRRHVCRFRKPLAAGPVDGVSRFDLG